MVTVAYYSAELYRQITAARLWRLWLSGSKPRRHNARTAQPEAAPKGCSWLLAATTGPSNRDASSGDANSDAASSGDATRTTVPFGVK